MFEVFVKRLFYLDIFKYFQKKAFYIFIQFAET